MKIEIKHRYTGDVIFSHDCENNTIKITVEAAVKLRVNLSFADLGCAYLIGADLGCANLSNANLRGANLRGADLSGANLRGADLSGADLFCANLGCANLSDVNLRGADLSNANLRGAKLPDANLSNTNLRGANLSDANILCQGDMVTIFTMQLDTWRIGFTKDFMKIGCQSHSLEKWKNFTDEEILIMDSKALSWWKKWKDFIFKAVELTIME
jgi:uncharacterized protein YjbI with pentapeptide repeats